MDVDGGNLDDDNIEREWWQVTVLTSVPLVDENDGRQIFKSAIEICLRSFIERH